MLRPNDLHRTKHDAISISTPWYRLLLRRQRRRLDATVVHFTRILAGLPLCSNPRRPANRKPALACATRGRRVPACRARSRSSRGVSMSPPNSDARRRLVGLSRFELLTPRLSSVCSNQLSYRPGIAYRSLIQRAAGSLKTE